VSEVKQALQHVLNMSQDERQALELRFFAKINKNGPISEYCPDLGACWLWTGSTRKDSRGTFRIAYGPSECATVFSYQLSWVLYTGKLPQLVLGHLCNTPSCVCGYHLVDQTYAANTQYMIQCGRKFMGPYKSFDSKLTIQARLQISELYKTGDYTRTELAKQFDVSYPRVYQLTSKG
jgi:hypothetical protein